MLTYSEARDAVLAAVAAECGCPPEALTTPGVRFVERPDQRPSYPLARRYPPRVPSVLAVSFGAGTVVAASPTVLPDIAASLRDAARDDIFDATRLAAISGILQSRAMQMAGPFPKLLCGADTLRDRSCPAGYRITLDHQPSESVLAQLDPARWPNTGSRLPDPNRPAMLLARAWHDDTLVGAATAGADSDLLWQIGIDVTPEAQGLGIGAALTATLARATLGAGRVPWYSVAASNLVSFRTALAAGFRFAWIEAYSVPLP
jgi:hypothetical protein